MNSDDNDRSSTEHAAPVPAAEPQDRSREPLAEQMTEPNRPLSAADFTAERMLRQRSVPPAHGWRRLVYRSTAGVVNLGPSAAEIRERELVARVKAPAEGARRIVVISRKGGVGKTTTTLMLGHTFACYRGDRIVALDGNPDAGSLGYRVRRETSATVTDLLRDSADIDRYADIRSYTSQSLTRLEVVAADDNPRINDALGESDYRSVVDLLEKHYNLILLDTGTGILDSATKGFLNLADQLILVTPASLDGARASSLTLDWLDEHSYGHLVKGAVTVINAFTDGGLVELDRIEGHFRARSRAVVRIPWDPLLQAGAETALDELKPATQHAYLDLAAAVADGFGPRWWMAPAVQA
jgi:putative peptide zinc metalloprotease protein